MNFQNIVQFFFHMSSTLKLYHWQTTNYARHVATDTLHTTLLPLIDQFVEVFIGKYSRSKVSSVRINVPSITDDIASNTINKYIDFLKNDLTPALSEKDTDLLNIIDEMLVELHKTLYLYTLN